MRELWRREKTALSHERQVRADEWRLLSLRENMMNVAKSLQRREREVDELGKRHAGAEAYRRELSEERSRAEQELVQERELISQLHREVLGLREACYLPAQLKKKSKILMKFLEPEGGRLATERNLRGVEHCEKLYQEVSVSAPNLQQLAGRAKSDMDAAFARYLRLEKSQGQLLQRMHLNVTKGLLKPPIDLSCGASLVV